MTEWFRTAFGAEYLGLYAHRDESEAQQAVELILKHTGMAPGSIVLDAPCGAGRHVRAFAAAGMRAMGMDLSPALLQSAKESSACASENCGYFRGDLRALPVKSAACDLVTNLFSSFGYFDSDEQNFDVLQELSRVIRPGGYLVLDFMNAAFVKEHLEQHSERKSAAGCHVTEERWITGAPERVNKRTIAVSSAGEQKEFFESVRLFTPMDLNQMMAQAGMDVRQTFGDYAGATWSEQTKRAILISRKGA
jgi:SAM-dependent methyltransferase